MTAIWQNDGEAWKLLTPASFSAEAALHDLVAQSPEMLPLSGSPRVVVLGREVPLGSGYADILAIEDNGRPVVIEVKLARNPESRRAVIAQVLAYAAQLQGMSPGTLDHTLARTTPGLPVRSAVESALGDVGSWQELEDGLAASLALGSFRLVLVLDDAPADLVRLVGYLEAITNDRISIDLITVASYAVGETQVVVPQRVDPGTTESAPDRQFGAASGTRQQSSAQKVDGSEAFEEFLVEVDAQHRDRLAELTEWAKAIHANGHTLLTTAIGNERRTLRLQVPGEKATFVTIWAEKHSPGISVHPTVVARRAPATYPLLLALLPQKAEAGLAPSLALEAVTADLLKALEAAYAEAAAGKLNVSS